MPGLALVRNGVLEPQPLRETLNCNAERPNTSLLSPLMVISAHLSHRSFNAPLKHHGKHRETIAEPLEGALEGVPVQLLEQRPAAAEADVVRRDLLALQLLQDLRDALPVHAIALDHPDVGRQQLVPRLRGRHILLQV